MMVESKLGRFKLYKMRMHPKHSGRYILERVYTTLMSIFRQAGVGVCQSQGIHGFDGSLQDTVSRAGSNSDTVF